MTKTPKVKTDPTDNLPASIVKRWAKEKHEALIHYVEASAYARRQFSESAFIDVYCGPGRAYIEESGEFIDGSPLAIARAAQGCRAPFTNFYINDENESFVRACKARLEKTGANVIDSVGPAQANISAITNILPRRGLKLAFIDPYNLVPFVTIDELAKIESMDILIHVSLYDLNRNVFNYVKTQNPKLNAFAPGVFDKVEARTKDQVFRDVFEYWKECISSTGLQIGERFKTIKGHNDVRYYWLALAARHKLADKIWSSIVSAGEERRLI